MGINYYSSGLSVLLSLVELETRRPIDAQVLPLQDSIRLSPNLKIYVIIFKVSMYMFFEAALVVMIYRCCFVSIVNSCRV